MEIQKFYSGNEFEAYEFLGAHVTEEGTIFRTFAPNAEKVSVIGEFNHFMETLMEPVQDGNFYECFIPNAKPGMKYQYRIYKNQQEYCDHSDPYGFSMEVRPGNCSVICDLSQYEFQDKEWIEQRQETTKRPVTIYEVHLGTFQKNPDGTWLTYEQLAQQLVNHVKAMGYNYIQFMPLAEHPLDESWGYQNTGFFSPTSRYGSPEGLKKLIDTCHQNHIGVIMDCSIVSFAIDSYGLADYDGQPLFEYPHKDVAINEWGSCNFIHSRGEVRSFLQSMAYYWLKEYHCDGLRFGSIQRLIYWQGEKHKGENGSAMDFLKCMNQELKKRFPSCILMTGTTGGFPKTTDFVSKSGLGFDYQWDMHWVEDTLKYMAYSPEKRKQQYYLLPFSMVYFQDEKYMMALSHDEAAHREHSVFENIYGELEDKFAQARVMYMYMYAHPGKILNFMGNESTQIEKWNGKEAIDWKLTKSDSNQKFMEFMRRLNITYKNEPSLYEMDYEEQGFSWVDCLKDGNCMYTMKRESKEDIIYAIFNFDKERVEKYTLNLGDTERVKVILSSDWEEFGGCSKHQEVVLDTERVTGGNQLTLAVPGFTAVYLKKV